MIKRFLIAFVLLALVGGGLVYFNMFRSQAIQDFFANRPQPAVPVQTVTVEPGDWQPGVEAIGTVSAARGVELALETGGIVEDVTFASNDMVDAGDLLVQIDDTIEQADLVAARASVRLNEQTLQRSQELRTRGVGTEATLEEAQANFDSARSQVARLEAVLNQKALKAPFSGTVGIPQVEAGQYVTTGAAVATLQDLDTMRVDFSVPEQQRGLLEIGQTVRLGSGEDALDYTGNITGIEPRIDPNTRLVSVRAEVDNRDAGLNPGQFVRVRVELPVESDVIALPQTAVVNSLYGDYVYIVVPAEAAGAEPAAQTSDSGAAASTASEEAAAEQPQAEADGEQSAEEAAPPAMQTRQVFVTTGRRNGNLVEVSDGLESGDIVVSAGQNRLSGGMPVTIDDSESPLEENVIEQVLR